MKETQRLDKILSNLGYGTRKEIKQAVRSGLVKVDGIFVSDSGMHVDPYGSRIEIAGETVNYKKHIYVMMNKPPGVVSATYDKRLKTVADILPDSFKVFELFPVGRLDIDTEGLLLMTNDGQLAHGLLSPRRHVSKRYYAVVDGEVTGEDVLSFKEGITIDDGYTTMPSELQILEAGRQSKIELTIYEGKFHQVKRMFQAVGKRVEYLKRIQMGGLRLDEHLKTGASRELTGEEEAIIKDVLA
ncbi:pseudouridine synthase [Anaerobacterium chartisolvens]|nr:pseudouridine synthase [Anaerobacterium chartisolvens]